MEQEILSGTIEKTNATDWKLSDWFSSQKTFRRPNAPRAVYNQLNLDPCACFFAAPFAAAADAFLLSPDDRVKARDAAVKIWQKLVADGKFVPGTGGYMSDGVDYARRGWNEWFPEKQVESYRVLNGSNDFLRIMVLGYAPIVGYYGSKEKLQDVLDDGIVQGDSKDASSYGHLVRIEQGFRVIDNYPTRGRLSEAGKNRYFLDDYDKKVKSGLMFKNAYAFLPKARS